MEPNISPWRRMVTGDLTTLFDFDDPDGAALGALPGTVGRDGAGDGRDRSCPRRSCRRTARCRCRSRASARRARCPIALHVHEATAAPTGLTLAFVNAGEAGAVFTAYAPDQGVGPWTYSLAAGTVAAPTRCPACRPDGAYAVAVHGPNGFLRSFDGDGATRPAGPLVPRSTMRRAATRS